MRALSTNIYVTIFLFFLLYSLVILSRPDSSSKIFIKEQDTKVQNAEEQNIDEFEDGTSLPEEDTFWVDEEEDEENDEGEIVVQTVYNIIRDVVTAKKNQDDLESLTLKLSVSLEKVNWGIQTRRWYHAEFIVNKILHQTKQHAKDVQAGGNLTEFQTQAIQSMANQLTAELEAQLKKPIAKAAKVPKALQGAKEVTWDDIGKYEWTEGMDLPKRVQNLRGELVSVRGFLLYLETKIDGELFILVESLWSCCYGVMPEINEVVVVFVPKEVGTWDDFPTIVKIIGKFEAKEEKDDEGYVLSLYRMTAEYVGE